MTIDEHAPGLLELTTLVRDCSVSGVARRVLLLRTDLMPSSMTRAHHLRLTTEALDPLTEADRARRYHLPHGRYAVSWRGEATDRLRTALEDLGHLLQDAPLDAPSLPDLARLFELPRDGAALLAVAGSPPHGAARQQHRTQEAQPSPALDLAALDTIETRLENANVTRFARRRMVCRPGPDGFAVTWETRYLSISELITALAPGRNPYAEPWLFRRMTRALDRRVLAMLASANELKDAGPIGLDLNVSGVLSPEFQRFDAALPGNLRGHTIINLHPADIMADVPAFRFACAFLRARKHRVLLRAVAAPLLPVIELPALELDFAELRWSPALAGLNPTAMRAGTARWVLGQTDDETAIRWGIGAGIGLFSGNAVRPGAGQGLVRTAA